MEPTDQCYTAIGFVCHAFTQPTHNRYVLGEKNSKIFSLTAVPDKRYVWAFLVAYTQTQLPRSDNTLALCTTWLK